MTDIPHEKFIAETGGRIDPGNPSSLAFELSDYQIFDDEVATVTFVYGGEGRQGIVMWNLGPGQENDYHQHPSSEHLHMVVEGVAEYTIAGGAPVSVGRGQAVMIPAGIPHGIRNPGPGRCSYIAVTSPGPYEKVLVPRD
jgi:quercetin dioxygenase-like cupin family protein